MADDDFMSTKANRGKFETVVVPIDGTDRSLRALQPAQTLAEAAGAELVATTIVAKSGDRAQVEKELQRRLKGYGVSVSRTVVQVNGFTIGQGLESVAYGSDTLVVLATDGHSRTRFLTGSVAEELIHSRTARPTILVGPLVDITNFDLSGPILLCVDPERASDRPERVAARTAEQLSLEPLAVSVVAPHDASLRPRSAGSKKPGNCDAFSPLSRGNEPEFSMTQLEGSNPAESIVDYAASVGASLLAVGTRQRVGLSRLAFGSVAISTVAKAHCPVLAVSEAL